MAYMRSPNLGEGDEYELRAYDGPPLYNVDEPREAAVIGWRAECFEALGFVQYLALVLAQRRDVDREQVQRLIGAGATPAQVADIVL